MAEVNAACDRWIAELRAGATGSHAGPAPSAPGERMPASHHSPPVLAPFRWSYAVGTVVVAALTAILIVMIVGPSVTTAAVGALFGACAGAAYLATVLVVARRE